jgi:protein-S-isoprenylcysteine O-methyltransferase Ste14
LGWIVIAIGSIIAGGCIFEFAWRGIGTSAPFDPPRRLVISGPYRSVRNPMYLGMGIILLGEGITFPKLMNTMLIMIASLWCALMLFIIGYEEPALRAKFCEDYIEYCEHVRRWIPRMRGWPV